MVQFLKWKYFFYRLSVNTSQVYTSLILHTKLLHQFLLTPFHLISGCNETLTSINDTFHSPNYPRTYPDGQYCSWRIKINTTQRIRLIFTNFTLQYESGTDELYVYDGENATGKILGVFYGAHPPPEEGIFSSSNHLFVMFRSDSKGSYAGFNVSYYGVSFPSKYSLIP